MKMYEKNIRIARQYLKNDMVNNYNDILDSLIRSARSDKAITYLKKVYHDDMFRYADQRFHRLSITEA